MNRNIIAVWYTETHEFRLHVNQYEVGTNEFMDLLLNADTAPDAFADFNRAVAQAAG